MIRTGRPIDEASILAGLEGQPDVAIRLYVGQPGAAIANFADEVPFFAEHGYVPTSQSWADGVWQSTEVALAVLLTLIGIGLLILAYMLVARPSGVLTVVYRPIAAAS